MDIITHAFSTNPNMLWIVKQDGIVKERLRVLCEYCLEAAMSKQGAFISSDGLGVLLAYSSMRIIPFLTSLRLTLMLIRHCISWERVPAVLYRQYCLGKLRPKEEHLYCIMLAVKNNTNGMNTVMELKNGLYEMSKAQNLPIYAETSIRKNKTAYERFGFKTYNRFQMKGADFIIWFLKREPLFNRVSTLRPV